jgi:hypothetical protein
MNIRGAKQARKPTDSPKYSLEERDQLAQAVAHAAAVENDMNQTVNTPYQSPFQQPTEARTERVDRRNAVMANVNGGVGPVFLAQRGDFSMCRNLLKCKNRKGIARFTFMIAGKYVMDEDTWPGSNKFWLYQYRCSDYSKLVRRMTAHSELEGWCVSDLGAKPMDFVATDRAIYDHLKRLVDAREINLKVANPSDFFSPDRNIKSIESWLSAMDEKYDNTGDW